ncbi:uncharacterized protein LOC141765488 [Sebastes fasciatus]|uniref:uncharacterized protein LOC141765488 n=1 Tax=Sebastes fasciatus TaxID=394691 RepID=UPI003D9E7B55
MTSDVIEEAEDRAARREAQALARRQQQRAEATSPAATSSTLPGGSRPSPRRTVPLGAAPATNSSLSTAGPSAPSAPSCASHGPRLPATTNTPASLPAEGHFHLPPSPGQQVSVPSTSTAAGLRGSQAPSSPFHYSQDRTTTLSSSSSSSPAGPTTSTGHTTEEMEETVWWCGRCRVPDPPESSEGLVSWVQCDNCHTWFHTMCVGWDEELDDDDDDYFKCNLCPDI